MKKRRSDGEGVTLGVVVSGDGIEGRRNAALGRGGSVCCVSLTVRVMVRHLTHAFHRS